MPVSIGHRHRITTNTAPSLTSDGVIDTLKRRPADREPLCGVETTIMGPLFVTVQELRFGRSGRHVDDGSDANRSCEIYQDAGSCNWHVRGSSVSERPQPPWLRVPSTLHHTTAGLSTSAELLLAIPLLVHESKEGPVIREQGRSQRECRHATAYGECERQVARPLELRRRQGRDDRFQPKFGAAERRSAIRIANASPPKRATTSCDRTDALSVWASATSARTPCACPRWSLMALKPSTSNTAKMNPGWLRLIHSRRVWSKVRRLAMFVKDRARPPGGWSGVGARAQPRDHSATLHSNPMRRPANTIVKRARVT